MHQGEQVHVVMMETVVMQVLQEFLECWDKLDYEETRELEELQDILETWVKSALLVVLDVEVCKVRRDDREHKDWLVWRDHRVLQERGAKLVDQVPLGQLDLLVLRDYKGCVDLVELMDVMV